MRITLTGSLGHIGKPLTQKLIEKDTPLRSLAVIQQEAKKSKNQESFLLLAHYKMSTF